MKFNRLVWLWGMVALCTFVSSYRLPLVEARSPVSDMLNGRAKTVRKSGTEDLTAPTLTAGSVTPCTGCGESTNFTFQVIYTDADNDAPTYVNLTLNWWSIGMQKENANDTDYTDGCVFVHKTTLSTDWNYSFSFCCSDGNYTVNTNEQAGPFIPLPGMEWNRTWSGQYDAYGRGMCISGDSIYTCGYTTAPSGCYEVLVVKWTMDGRHVWNRTWGPTFGEIGMGVFCDGVNVFVAGYCYGYNYSCVILVDWDVNGTLIGSYSWGCLNSDSYGIGIWGDANSLYVTGYTIGSGSTTSSAFLVKWSKTGIVQWYRTCGGSSSDYGIGIYGDNASIYVVGETYSNNASMDDAFLAKWTKNGTFQFYTTWGGSGNDGAHAVWCDDTGVYAVGYTSSFGIYSDDAVLLKWSKNGTYQFYKTWASWDYGYGISGDSSCVYITGVADGGSCVYFCQFSKTGMLLQARTWTDQRISKGFAICVNSTSIYICGKICTLNSDMFLLKINLASQDLISPQSGSVVYQNNQVQFQWNGPQAIEGLANYTWQISNTPTFTVITDSFQVVNVRPGTTACHLVYITYSVGTYYWRVRPIRGSQIGNWCTPANFRVVTVVKLSSLSISPLSGDTDTLFTFRIKYTDSSNKAPQYLDLTIEGLSLQMEQEQPASTDFQVGCYYTCSIKLWNGSNEFYISGYDNGGNWVASNASYINVSQHIDNTDGFANFLLMATFLTTCIVLMIICCMFIYAIKKKNMATHGLSSNGPWQGNHISRYTTPHSSSSAINYQTTAHAISSNPAPIPTPRQRPLPPDVNPCIPRSAFINPVPQSNFITPDQTVEYVTPRMDAPNLDSLDPWDDEAWITPAPVNILLYDDARDGLYAIVPNNHHVLAPKVNHAYVDAKCLNMISPDDTDVVSSQSLAKIIPIRDEMQGHLVKLDITLISCMALLNIMKEKDSFSSTGRMSKNRLARIAAERNGCLPGIYLHGIIDLMQSVKIITSITAKTIVFAPWLLEKSTLEAFNAAVLSAFKKFNKKPRKLPSR
ncbi:MAG TPA: hypothetical protein VKM55_12030 [Candidatus Lokiarchaeia archaeon]|nr:hypothetical protein [Candidatus Lokiarchaeia archaeon]